MNTQWEFLTGFIKKYRVHIAIIFVSILIVDMSILFSIYNFHKDREKLKIYFLDVGQGDSELVILPGGAKILIDAGPPNKKVLQELSRSLPIFDRRIDLVSISHPQLDHFGSMADVVKQYRVGAFLSNGSTQDSDAFRSLQAIIKEKALPMITLTKGDKIHYGKSLIRVLNPSKEILEKAKDDNDTSLVLELESVASALFTGDAGIKVEKMISPMLASAIDILKVSHHGSKYSTDENFLKVASPSFAAIEVGKNSYGHPTKEVLEKLKKYGVKIFRTDKDGTIKIEVDGKTIRVFSVRH